MYDATKVKELATNQYYDLLDRYIELKNKYGKLKSELTKAKLELGSFREEKLESEEDIIKNHNARLERILKIAFKHKTSKEFLEELKYMKIDPSLQV